MTSTSSGTDLSIGMDLSIGQRQALLESVHAPWTRRTIDGLLSFMADARGGSPFVVTDDRIWTYREMDHWVERLSAGLIAAGVKPGEQVAVVMANHPEFVAVKFAISRVGAVMVPVNFLNRRDELAFVLRQSDAVMLVTMASFRDLDYLGMLDELAPGWEGRGGGSALPSLRQVVVFGATGRGRACVMSFADLEREGSVPLPPGDPAGLADVIYTSGTTGSPKGVMLTHDMMLRAAYGSAFARAFEPGRRIAFALPMYHVFGYVEGLLAAMFVAGAIVPRLRFEAADLLDSVDRHAVTDLLMVPTMTLAVLDEQRRRPRMLASLYAVLSSGGRAPAYLWDALREGLGVREITTGYGMTECTASTTVTRPDDPVERLLSTNGRLREVGAAGRESATGRLVDYRVLDPATGEAVADGEVGELVASGIGVTTGYYRNPEATAAAFTPDGWFRTGDLARLDGDGYLTLAGRLKESYRCGGETVLPGDAEDLLALHPAVLQAHVVPVPDERMGEVGAAFIVLRPEAAFDALELQAYCQARLARFKVPKYWWTIAAEQVPVTPSGRARKFLLGQMALKLLAVA